MNLNFRFFYYFLIVAFFQLPSMTHAQQTYQLDWGFNINGANASLTIEQGDTVEWTWIDTGQHNVVNTANAVETFDSGLLQGVGTTFSHTFTEVGVNDFECSPHNNNMFGTITVTAPANNNFYLAPNGVTCMCPNAAVGDSGDPGDGVVYTKRERNEITPQNAATTCTSGITDMSNLFDGQVSFNENISSWDTSQVTNMYGIFNLNFAFNQTLEFWDVSNVINFSYMFGRAKSFNQPLNGWDVSSGQFFEGTFIGAAYNLPLDNWDMSNAVEAWIMFGEGEFNQPIGNWDVSNINSFGAMFYRSQYNHPLNNWDVSSGTIMEDMFAQSQFNHPLTDWDVSNVTNMKYMFGNSNFDQPLNSWIFNSNIDFFRFLNNASLSVENYDALLESLYDQNLNNKFFGDLNLNYCNLIDHDGLINDRGWTFEEQEGLFIGSLTAPPDIINETDPGLCVASNVDLGQPTADSCGTLSITNNAPTEFPLGITTVTWTLVDSNGTTITDNQQVEVIMVADEAEVCYVTADTVQPNLNRVFITSDPTLSGQNVEFHEVQRETPSGGYETIGFIVPPEDSFLDVTSDNNTQAYRYKVQTTDVCGQVLTLSDFHKTILLQSSIATDNSVNLAWNPYIGVTFNTYNVYRSVNGANYELLTSLSSTNTSYNDTSANVVDNFYEYYISINVASCSTDPFQSFELESNREYINPNLAIGDKAWLRDSIKFYPNPSSGKVNVSVSEGINVKNMTIYSALGQVILKTSMSQKLDLSSLPGGVYYIKTLTDKGTVSHSLIKQ
jgi:surface protein